jgi:probable phosphomutase (TIGR03848 family)
MMTVFLLIRHGENDSIARDILAGRKPGVHLNNEGMKQAVRISEILADIPIKAIYSSPLERAMETARLTAELRELPVLLAPGLIEADYGKWQGKSFKELRRLKLWKQVHETPSKVRFPGGESILEIHDRVVKEIDHLAGNYGEKDIVAGFSHADILRIAISHYLNMPLDDFHRLQIDTASITILTLSSAKPRLSLINFTENIKLEKFLARQG